MIDQNYRLFCFDDIKVSPSDFKIWRDDKELVLEPKVLQVLLYLLNNRGRLVEKSELLDAVWKDTFVTENAMTREIAKLRKALGDDPKEARYIQTVHTRGYRFIANVVESTNGKQSEVAVSESKSPKIAWLPGLTALLVLGLLALLVVISRIAQSRFGESEAISVQEVEQITNWSGLDDYPALSPDGNSIAYCSDHNGSLEIYVKQLTPGAKEIQLTNDSGHNIQPAWSPDGLRLAYHSRLRNGIWVIPATGGEGKQLSDFGAYPSWSPDGTTIAFQSGQSNAIGAFTRNVLPPSSLWLIPSQGGQAKPLTQLGNPAGGHGSPHWSPDGRHVLFTTEDSISSSVWTVDVRTGGLQSIAKNRSYDATYAPDGNSVVFLTSTQQNAPGVIQQIKIDPKTGAPLGEPLTVTGLAGVPANIRRLSFSRNGQLAYNALSARGSLMSVVLSKDGEVSGSPVPLINNISSRIHSPSFSPDGKRIAFAQCKAGGTFCDIWLIDSTGGNPAQLTTDSHNELIPNWFPDQKEISYLSTRTGYGTIWAIDLETRRERLLLDMKSDIEYARLSPDGKRLAFNFRKDGVVNVWTASIDGSDVRQITFDKEFSGFPNWSPDGKSFIVQVKRGENQNLALISSDGGAPVELTSDKGQNLAHSWSPDGGKVAFVGLRDGFWILGWVRLKSREEKQLTHESKLNAYLRYPSWSPAGNQMVYEYSETTGNIWIADCK